MRAVRILAAGLALALAAACARSPVSASRIVMLPDSLPVDHVILAIDSLERGIELLRLATGVTPVYGGAHPGRGTRNALLSLGHRRYLELLAPNPDDTSATARQGEAARARYFGAFRALTPAGWAIHVPDADAERARLLARGLRVSEVGPGSRARTDGSVLRWRTIDPWGEDARDALPFVIEWASESPHPSADAPAGCALASLAIGSPASDSLRAQFERAGWPVAVHDSTAEQLEIVLDCPSGRVRYP